MFDPRPLYCSSLTTAVVGTSVYINFADFSSADCGTNQPVRIDYSLDKLVELYIKEIVRLHGIPILIISDRDSGFSSRFWRKFQEAWGTRRNFSTTFHPETDGQLERVIHVLEDMLRNFVIDYEGS